MTNLRLAAQNVLDTAQPADQANYMLVPRQYVGALRAALRQPDEPTTCKCPEGYCAEDSGAFSQTTANCRLRRAVLNRPEP
jgi:hypothetical protein